VVGGWSQCKVQDAAVSCALARAVVHELHATADLYAGDARIPEVPEATSHLDRWTPAEHEDGRLHYQDGSLYFGD
jgi:hypothetical protein